MEKNPKQRFVLVRRSCNCEQEMGWKSTGDIGANRAVRRAAGDLQEIASESMLLSGPLQVKLAEAAAAKQGGKTEGRTRPPWIGKNRTQGLLRISLVTKDGREMVRTEACLRFQ